MKKLLGLVLAVALVLGFAATTHAADTYIGICFEIGWGNDPWATQDPNNVGWFWGELEFSASAKIGEHGSVFVKFYNEFYIDDWGWDDGMGGWDYDYFLEMFDFANISYGYTYKFNDQFSLGVVRGGNETLSGTMASDKDWDRIRGLDDLQGRLVLTATPMEGLTINAAVEPSDMDIMVKGEFAGEIFKIGAGYLEGTYNVYGEVMPVDGLKIYGEYISDGAYLVKGSYAMDPFTFTVLYGNVSNGNYGQWGYMGYTLDATVDYALSDTMTLTGGLAYLVPVGAIWDVWGKVTFGNAYVSVIDYLLVGEIVGEAGYKLDGSGSSLLYGAYNFTTGTWWVGLYSEIW